MEIVLNTKTVPVGALKPNAWNPNKQSSFVFDKELNSIRQFGFIAPVIVRETAKGKYEIIDGEHRWKAAKELGFKDVPINSLGKIDAATAKKLTIILNELRGDYDMVELAKLVKGLADDVGLEELVRDLPFPEQEIQNIIDAATFDVDSLKRPPREGDAAEDDQWTELKFMVSESQAGVITNAISRIVTGIPVTGKNPDARALELICADSLATPLESLK